MPLYIVPTPIGNLSDITLRALEVLGNVDLIACEDTRRTGRLLEAHEISGPKLVSYHEHNEKKRATELGNELAAGKSIALISDAGTPLVSDPGYRLVQAALEHQIEITPLPGPNAAITALSAAGLPVHQFSFLGFPPKGPGKLRNMLADQEKNGGTLISYESPHRIGKLFAAAEDVLGADRIAAACRELTKLHEETLRGTAATLAAYFSAPSAPTKGEFVALIGPEGVAWPEGTRLVG